MTETPGPVLVTGGAGFIGSHVTRKLLAGASEVAIVDNLHAGRRELVPEEAGFHEVDLRDAERLAAVIDDVNPSHIVHLAALHHIPYCEDHVEETVDVNLLGTRHLLEVARNLDALRSVAFASTAAVYPPNEGPCAEHLEPGPIDIYGKTKALGEDLAALFARETGVSTVAARLFNVYGPDETNPHLIPAIVDQLRDGASQVELGNLEPRRDFVHVDDAARALCDLLEFDGGYRVYNVGTGRARSVREVVETAIAALGADVELVQAAERVRETDRPHLEADTSRIADEVGWTPRVSFEDGLRDLLRTEGVMPA